MNDIVSKGAEWLDHAKRAVIRDDNVYRTACEGLQTLKAHRKEMEAHHEPLIKASHATWQSALTLRNEHTHPMIEAEKLLTQKLVDYDTAKRKAAEECAARRALELAEAEEQLRAKAAAAVAAVKVTDEDMPVDESEIDMAMMGQRQAITEQALASIPSPPEQVKVKGIANTSTWDFIVLDASKLNKEFILPDEKKIRAIVKSLGEGAVNVVGLGSIEVKEKAGMSVRVKR